MPSLKTITIFLASSAELKEERDNFRLFISGLNDKLVDHGVYLKIIQWEKFLDAISDTRLQDEYNKALVASDIALCLFFTKVGKFTNEEFNTAYASFKATGKPKIWTYFKDAPVNYGSITKEVNTLFDFKDKLSQLGHFYTSYKDTRDLHGQFRDQLEIVIPELVMPVPKKKKTAAGTPEPTIFTPPIATIQETNPVTVSQEKNNSLEKIEELLEEPTDDNVKSVVDLFSKLAKGTPSATYLLTLKAEFAQYKQDKLAGYNMNGRLNALLVRLTSIIAEFKKSMR